MTDELNDCQGETCLHCGGKGFRTEDGGNSFRVCECAEIWPNETAAHANGFEMGYRAHTEVADAELERLKAELREAREVICGLLTEVSDMETKLVCWTKDVLKEFGNPDLKLTIETVDTPPAVARARAFLKGEKNDG